MEIVEVPPGDERLAAVYPVMRELRADLSEEQFMELYAAGHVDGYRLAALFEEHECLAVAGYRILTNFVSARHLYIDDLVTAEGGRSQGYGRQLNDYLIELARGQQCTSVQLDSNVRRHDAHRFYFRERYVITAFHFGRYV
jgi:GNAT superfamily N-acetyltransferase